MNRTPHLFLNVEGCGHHLAIPHFGHKSDFLYPAVIIFSDNLDG
jgi:hypothetical protein